MTIRVTIASDELTDPLLAARDVIDRRSCAWSCAGLVVGSASASIGSDRRSGAGGRASAPAASTTRSTPTRIFDTRSAASTTRAARAEARHPGAARRSTSDVLGQGGLPAEVAGVNRDVLAVVVNITVDRARPQPGTCRSSGTGRRRGRLVARQLQAGENVPNLGDRRPGTERRGRRSAWSCRRARRTAHVLVDVFGWISTSDYPDTDDAAPGSSRSVPDASSTPVVPTPAGWPAAGRWPRRSLTLPIRGADSVLPGGHRHRAEHANVTGVHGQHHRRQRPHDSQPRSCRPRPTTPAGGHGRPRRTSTCARGQVKAEHGDRAGRRRRQHPALQRVAATPT